MATPFIDLGEFLRQPIASNDTNSEFKFIERRRKLFMQTSGADALKQRPLTKVAMVKKLPGARNAKVIWGMQAFDARNFEVAGVYADVGLITLIAANADNTVTTPGGVKAGATVYIKAAAINSDGGLKNLKRLRMNEQVEIMDIARHRSVFIHISNVIYTGAPYAIGVLKTTDPCTGGVSVLSQEGTGNLWLTKGATSYPENGKFLGSALQEPTQHYNYCETFMESSEMTGEEMSDDSVWNLSNKELKRMQALNEFNEQIEDALRWGVRMGPDDDNSTTLGRGTMSTLRDGQSANGKRYTMGGLYWFLSNMALDDAGAATNILRIPDITAFNGVDYTGDTWDYSGKDFLLNLCAFLAAHGGPERRALCGRLALKRIEDALEYGTQITIGPWTDDKMGFRVRELRGGEVTLLLQADEKFSMNPAHSRDMLILDDDLLAFQAKQNRDLTLIKSTQLAANGRVPTEVNDAYFWRDAAMEGWHGEGTMVIDDLEAFVWVHGVGNNFHA